MHLHRADACFVFAVRKFDPLLSNTSQAVQTRDVCQQQQRQQHAYKRTNRAVHTPPCNVHTINRVHRVSHLLPLWHVWPSGLMKLFMLLHSMVFVQVGGISCFLPALVSTLPLHTVPIGGGIQKSWKRGNEEAKKERERERKKQQAQTFIKS